MTVARKLRDFLDEQHAPYAVLQHEEKFTSPEIAQSLHVPGREMAKVVIVQADGRLVMAVLPSDRYIDLTRFADATHAEMVGLATEEDFRRAFPDCEVGAMPPFGNLYGVEVLVDEALTRDTEIAFEAGNHHEAIRMTYRDYAELVQPKVADFGQKA